MANVSRMLLFFIFAYHIFITFSYYTITYDHFVKFTNFQVHVLETVLIGILGTLVSLLLLNLNSVILNLLVYRWSENSLVLRYGYSTTMSMWTITEKLLISQTDSLFSKVKSMIFWRISHKVHLSTKQYCIFINMS